MQCTLHHQQSCPSILYNICFGTYVCCIVAICGFAHVYNHLYVCVAQPCPGPPQEEFLSCEGVCLRVCFRHACLVFFHLDMNGRRMNSNKKPPIRRQDLEIESDHLGDTTFGHTASPNSYDLATRPGEPAHTRFRPNGQSQKGRRIAN